ncbi:MAG: Gfo/Idh/MocA family oxidoreductase [Nitrospirae bacterium]|nr:Gfo/Idh/MocA family oxidoreductase [Nitrospirota bacterium]
MPLKVAVVGAGYLGQHHARIYSELPEAELVGVVDTDEERAKEVAAKYGAGAYSDYRDILGGVAALSIAVPTTRHFEIALDCIRAGKDLLVEKPFTATLPEADELMAEAEKREAILQVGHLERYNPGFVALSRMVEGPRFLDAVRLSPFLDRCFDVDVTLDLMIHDVDILLSLVASPVKSLGAFGFSLVTKKIDEARVWIEFENGTKASLVASRIAPHKQRRLRVFQGDSLLELDYQTSAVERRSLRNRLDPERFQPEHREPLREELKDFIRCVAGRERPRVSGREARNALKVVLEINAALERR